MLSPHISSALAEERQSRYRSEGETRRASPRRRRRMFRRSRSAGEHA